MMRVLAGTVVVTQVVLRSLRLSPRFAISLVPYQSTFADEQIHVQYT